jgi:hypothetical protein
LARVRETLPGYGVGDFMAAFHLAPEAESLFREAAKRVEGD